MEHWKARLFSPCSLTLGESPLWDQNNRQFLCVDILERKILAHNEEGRLLMTVHTPEIVSAIFPTDRRSYIIAVKGALREINLKTGESFLLTEIEPEQSDNRPNDGGCDPAGRLWIGTMHMNAEGRTGSLYQYENNGLKRMLTNRAVSNGLCWSGDRKTMYYIDSFDYDVKAFDFDEEHGTIANAKTIIEFGRAEGIPDGMTIDENDNLWIALWGGGSICCYNPSTGKRLGVVNVPVPHVTSCVFGGAGMNDLFITTAKTGLTPDQLRKFPLSGDLFITQLGEIRGTYSAVFKTSNYGTTIH